MFCMKTPPHDHSFIINYTVTINFATAQANEDVTEYNTLLSICLLKENRLKFYNTFTTVYGKNSRNVVNYTIVKW